MEKYEFSILSRKEAKRFFKDGTTYARETDFTILLGNWRHAFWTSDCEYTSVFCFDISYGSYSSFDSLNVGCRPVIAFPTARRIAKDLGVLTQDVVEVEGFSYPQTIASIEEETVLEELYKKQELKETGKTYSVCLYEYGIDSKYDDELMKFIEYEYKGERFIRVFAIGNSGNPLSDGRIIKKQQPYWIKVEPIKFILNRQKNIAITRDIIFSGVPFDIDFNIDGKFRDTYLYKYLNEVFAKDIIPSKTKDVEEKEIEEDKKEYINGINKEEESLIRIELSGNKKELIEVLKTIQKIELINKDNLVKLKLLEQDKDVKLEINNSHYRCRK